VLLILYLYVYIYIYICVVLLYVFTFLVPCCDVRYDFRIKTMSGWSLPPVVSRRAYFLLTLFLFVHSGAQHILRCVFCFVLFVFISCLA
jgi:hypothetical protein